jgi:hypothetical protein
MIEVECFTNLDGFDHEQWPRYLVCRPLKGDWIESIQGKRLYVYAVTHMPPGRGFLEGYLKVELNR